ncbi:MULTISPECIES: hypothetical protein [unclassified Flammeovirga]|uniref:hypothetical protein n=1 Tax=unclassified Flammeovirga TaxID=2637820 RepID=UPI0005C64222|nr:MULTISPECIES: hypothetical protein [unclassified Flammeovirga]MBD0402856.1 hypothetical protein [Flammeovirga sp. EKP202]
MSIIKTIKLFFSDNQRTIGKVNDENVEFDPAVNKAYYQLLNQRIKERKDNLDKLQRAVREMQCTFQENQTEASHIANLKALNAMIDLEEHRLVEEF